MVVTITYAPDSWLNESIKKRNLTHIPFVFLIAVNESFLILMILFIKEGYSTLFWNQTSNVFFPMLLLNIFLYNLILQRRFAKKSRNL